MTQKYTGSSEKFTAEKSAAHRRNARRISARQFSLGVQRQVLNRLSAGRQGREHGNGPQNCGSTGFRRRRAGRASKKTTTKQPGMREEDSAMRVHQQTMRAHQIAAPPRAPNPSHLSRRQWRGRTRHAQQLRPSSAPAGQWTGQPRRPQFLVQQVRQPGSPHRQRRFLTPVK